MSRPDKTLVDYVVIAIIPALIMMLVGSLVFFLLTVFYQGQYEARLHFIFAMFVMATVLIARISMNEGVEYAALFAIPLAIAAGLAMLRFVAIRGPLAPLSLPINVALLGVVWWSAHRLTWDCTLIDEHEDAIGQGLLQSIGLDDTPTREAGTPGGPGGPGTPTEDLEGTTSREEPASGLWRRYVERQRRPHAPGVWVVYFSLAALPIFGFGQGLIPESDAATRRYAFQLLCVYVTSGLALLLTTSFLGLRRYLRQRHVDMSIDMVQTWLVTGGVLIVLLMAFCSLLPRPNAEYSVSQLPFQFGTPGEPGASPEAFGETGPREERPGARPGDGDESSGHDEQPETRENRSSETSRRSQEDGQPTSERPSSSDRGDEPSDASRDAKGASTTSDDRSADTSGPASQARQTAEDDGDASTQDRHDEASPSRSQDKQNAPVADDGDSEDSRGEGSTRPPGRRDAASRPRSPPRPMPRHLLSQPGSTIMSLLKLVFYAAALLGTAYLLWHHGDRVKVAWHGFLEQIRDLWRRLFGRRSPLENATADEPEAGAMRPRPFSDFADPFSTGLAGRCSVDELVDYSFEALEAWARERGCPREADQTPHEFARHVATCQQSIGHDARNLAALYSRLAYAQGDLPASSVHQLRSLWRQLKSPPQSAA